MAIFDPYIFDPVIFDCVGANFPPTYQPQPGNGRSVLKDATHRKRLPFDSLLTVKGWLEESLTV